MAGDEYTEGMPGPDPELKRLERFLGSWTLHGRTLDSDEDNVSGTTTFEWLPGGFFMQQRVQIDFTGMKVEGVEIIGYDPATKRFPSTVFSNMIGVPIAYEYDVRDDGYTITTDLSGGATFTGTFGDDGSMSGGWRPNPGVEDPGNIAYDVAGTRVS
jgi:hypothetical protein